MMRVPNLNLIINKLCLYRITMKHIKQQFGKQATKWPSSRGLEKIPPTFR